MADLPINESDALPVIVTDSTTPTRQLTVYSDGSLSTASVDGFKATYSAAALNVTSAATATDIFTIFGSGTKTMRVLEMGMSGVQTTASDVIVQLIKRSTANTGGTSSSATNVPHDSNNTAATATVLSYTANPTALGASMGTIRAGRLFVPPAGANSAAETLVFTFGNGPGQAIVLRGTAQGLCVNLNSTTTIGGSFSFWVTWTEE